MSSSSRSSGRSSPRRSPPRGSHAHHAAPACRRRGSPSGGILTSASALERSSCAGSRGRSSPNLARCSGSARARRAARPRRRVSSSSSGLVGDVEAVGVERRPWRGTRPIGVSTRLALAVAAAEDPLEHARVLAEPGPQELAVVVLAEPVDVEDLRQLRAVALGRSSSQCAK